MSGFNLSDWNAILVRIRLDTLRDFGSDIEQWAKNEASRFKERIVNASTAIDDPERREEYLEFHSETFHQYDKEYPQLNREMIWVKANFILESTLTEVVEWVEKNKGTTPSYKKFKAQSSRSSEIGFAVNYLDKIAGLHVPRPQLRTGDFDAPVRIELWNDVEIIRVVRNAIVHSDGVLRSADVPTLGLSALGGSVTLDQMNRLSFPGPVHDAVVTSLRRFFDYIEKRLYP